MQGAGLDLPAVGLGRHHCGYTPWQQDAQQYGGLLRIHNHASICRANPSCFLPCKPIKQQTCRLKGKHAHVLRHWQGFISIFPVEISWTVMTVMNKSEPDASMVCPCWPQVAHRARNMEAVQCKEQDSTCLQLVWDATTVDIHHDNKMPNSMVGCWEYTAMRPHVVQTHHASCHANPSRSKPVI